MTMPKKAIAAMMVAGVCLLTLPTGTTLGAEEGDGPRLPEGIRGFKGILVGTLVSKGDFSFVLKVHSVKREWRASRAENPESVVGKRVRIALNRRGRLAERHFRTLRHLRAGNRVEVEVFHLEGNVFTVVEMLRRVEGEAEGERREGERRDGERREGDRKDGERRDGEHRDGERRDGDRKDGERREGDRKDGERRDGELRDGERRDGERREGDRKDGEGRDGERREGERREGERRDGERREGELRDGERRDGERREGERREGERRDGERREGERREGEREGRPGFLGFRGILVGTIEWKSDVAFKLRVRRVEKAFKGSRARAPRTLLGRVIKMTLRRKGRVNERMTRLLRGLKVGDRVRVGALHLERDYFLAAEMLKKAE